MKAILRLGAGAFFGLVLIFILLITSMLARPARALELSPGQCLSYPALTEQLADRFGEKIFFFGEHAAGAVSVQVAASPQGSWTVFLVDKTKNAACILFYGNAWTGETLPAQGEEL